jgi:hypothetical protein
MGKKKARVRAGIPKFQPNTVEVKKQERSLQDAGYLPVPRDNWDNPDEEVMICIGANDFKYDYTEDGISVLTTIGCIDKTISYFKERDAKVGVKTLKKSKAKDVRVCQVYGDPQWKKRLKELKDVIEEKTPEELWNMGEGQEWQDWIDNVCHYYFLRTYIKGICLPVCEPLQSMRGVLGSGEGACNITMPVNFDSTESTVPTHLQ